MSYRLIHVLTHGARLSKDRGSLIMTPPITLGGEAFQEQSPIEDVLGVIIAARGISLSGELISALSERRAFILHCDHSYCPIGLTEPLAQTTRPAVILQQTAAFTGLHERLWKRILVDKVRNQMRNIALENVPYKWMKELARPDFAPDEAEWARRYWQLYFWQAGEPGGHRDQQSDSAINSMLNYGYAVLQAIVHRSIVCHGMIPNLGFHHTCQYHGYPLVYDLMEPFRAFVEALLLKNLDMGWKVWIKMIATCLIREKVWTPKGDQNLLSAMDDWVANIATCLCKKDDSLYWNIINEPV